jgi:5-methylcytosine-specific restriction endonuclease McrA
VARIRTIKPEFWQDEKLGPLDPLTRLVFLGLVSQADDAGRLLDSPRLINGVLFPYTDDDCSVPLEELAAVGVIQRGTTASGQPVIQICGWSKHQRIEKPNLSAALGEVADVSTTRRRSVGNAVRAAIIARAEGRCENCGIEVKAKKDNKYDSAPNLAEIDHIVPVADGGTDEPENLRLLCLRCNRRKAGEDLSARNRRRVADESPTNRRPDLRSTTNDQRSTIEQTRPTADAVDGRDIERDFEVAWQAYPRRPGNSRGKALKAYIARRKAGASAEELLAGVRAYAGYIARERVSPQYVKHGKTFFASEDEWRAELYAPVQGSSLSPGERVIQMLEDAAA